MKLRLGLRLVAAIAFAAIAGDVAARSMAPKAARTVTGSIALSERIIDSRGDVVRIVVINANGSRRRALPPARCCHSWSPAWSPDARQIAFVTNDFQRLLRGDLWVMNANGSSRHRLARNADRPAWSPDGRSIAFQRGGDIYVMSADGGEQRGLTRRGAAPTWSPDGNEIAFVRAVAPRCYRRIQTPRCRNSYEIYVMHADGTEQRRLTRNRVSESDPDWSPSGTQIAYERLHAPEGGSSVFVMRADGSGQHRLTPARGQTYEPSWSPDGTKIVYTYQSIRLLTINADRSGRRVLYPRGGFICEACGEPAWSRR